MLIFKVFLHTLPLLKCFTNKQDYKSYKLSLRNSFCLKNMTGDRETQCDGLACNTDNRVLMRRKRRTLTSSDSR